jgi:hypothetical protein
MATLHVPFTGREMGCALLLALPLLPILAWVITTSSI